MAEDTRPAVARARASGLWASPDEGRAEPLALCLLPTKPGSSSRLAEEETKVHSGETGPPLCN